jgi:glycosyltransferase involved in cell wall biosynthesis
MMTIYYDITDVLAYAPRHRTLGGIQRVSIGLLSLLVANKGNEHLKVIAFHPNTRRVASFDASYFARPYNYDQQKFCQAFGLTSEYGSDLQRYLDRKYSNKSKKSFHQKRLLILNSLTRGSAFRTRNIKQALKSSPMRELTGAAPNFEPGDVIFIPGANWNFDTYSSFLAKERNASGIRVIYFIHDLIPLLAPEHVVEGVAQHFARWLAELARNADGLLTNSLATKSDLDCWLTQNGKSIESRVVRLAHQFGSSDRIFETDEKIGVGQVRSAILNAARLPYALCVGTIESRKNIWLLANVWKSVYENLGDKTPRLIFAGAQGWLKDDFDDFIRGTGSLYGYIRVVERPTDAELSFLYRNCLFSIFPSLKEGWGLPIGECLWHGRPVICSNTSSMPEVGGALADYVDPTSHSSILSAVIKMIVDSEFRELRAAQISKSRLRTWSDVADDLWQELTQDVHTGSTEDVGSNRIARRK